MSLQGLLTEATVMTLANVAVKLETTVTPTKIHTAPKRRPKMDLGVLSPYLHQGAETIVSLYNDCKYYFVVTSVLMCKFISSCENADVSSSLSEYLPYGSHGNKGPPKSLISSPCKGLWEFFLVDS